MVQTEPLAQAPNGIEHVWRPNQPSNVCNEGLFQRSSSLHSSEILPWMSCCLRSGLSLTAAWPRTAPRPLLVPCLDKSAQVMGCDAYLVKCVVSDFQWRMVEPRWKSRLLSALLHLYCSQIVTYERAMSLVLWCEPSHVTYETFLSKAARSLCFLESVLLFHFIYAKRCTAW